MVTIESTTPKNTQTTPAGFTRIDRPGREPLFYRRQDANLPRSMTLLDKNGLAPLTCQDFLASARELTAEFGKTGAWFWGAGKGLKESGKYTYDAQGRLQPLQGNETYDQIVRAFPGDKPLAFLIYSPADAADNGWQLDLAFGLVANGFPRNAAPVVIGKLKQTDPGRFEVRSNPNQVEAGTSLMARGIGAHEGLRRLDIENANLDAQLARLHLRSINAERARIEHELGIEK